MTPITHLRHYQALLAPGTALRDGLERIVSGRTGALIALGASPAVAAVCTGGFHLDTPFAPTALRELAKMDGGIVVTQDLSRIVRAGVHFAPDPGIATAETGTRHASADRLSQQTGVAVVTVSASMSVIALYLNGERHLVERPDALAARGNQALSALGRYHERLRAVTETLSALEVSDQVTVREVAVVSQRLELVRRLADEVAGYVVQLGAEGRLLELQLHEVTAQTGDLGRQIQLDYPPPQAPQAVDPASLSGLSDDELLDLGTVSASLGLGPLDSRVSPRGIRQLLQISQLPPGLAPRLLEQFGGLQGVLAASQSDLVEVDGVTEASARLIRDRLLRLTEAAYQIT